MAKAKTRHISLRFPLGGVDKRTSYQDQPPYTAYTAKNVYPDTVSDGRERGGARPGLSKVASSTLSGPIRMLHEINVATETGTESILVCSAAGNFYRYNNSSGDWDQVSSSYSLSTTSQIQAAVFGNKLYIADYGVEDSGTNLVVDEDTATIVHLPVIYDDDADATYGAPTGDCDAAGTTFWSQLESDTDGAVAGDGVSFTSATIGDFAAAGVTTDHVVRIVSGGGTPGVYGISNVATTTITLSTSPGSTLSGLTFQINQDLENVHSVTTSHLLRVEATGNQATAVVGAYAISAVDTDQLTVASMNGGGGVDDGIDFEIRQDFSSATITSDDHGLEVLEDGNGTAGFYPITNVEADQITLGSSPGASGTSGIEYRIHRVPKVWTLTDSYTTDSISKWTASSGTLPLSCRSIAYFQDRIILAGAPSYPQAWYASKQGDPTNFNYDGDTVESAVDGQSFFDGKIGDPITALIPHNRHCMLIGADDSLYVLRGDPNSPSATLEQLSGFLGPISSLSWCQDNRKTTWMLTRDGVYTMPAGCGEVPQSVSRERLPVSLLNVDPAAFDISMGYDINTRSVQIFKTSRGAYLTGSDGVISGTSFTSATIGNFETAGITVESTAPYYLTANGTTGSGYDVTGVSGSTITLSSSVGDDTGITFVLVRSGDTGATSAEAWWVDADRRGFWPMEHIQAQEITSVCVYSRISSDDLSGVMLGTRGGLVLQYDKGQSTDSGSNAITSFVAIGPFRLTRSAMERAIITSARLITARTTPAIAWQVIAGAAPEHVAQAVDLSISPDWEFYDNARAVAYTMVRSTNNYVQTQHPRVAGTAGVVYLSNSGNNQWAVDSIDLEVMPAGRSR